MPAIDVFFEYHENIISQKTNGTRFSFKFTIYMILFGGFRMINWNLYKLSRFNVSTTDRDGNILLTNTITNVFVKIINNKKVPIPSFEMNKKLFDRMSKSTLNKMIQYGVIVKNEMNQDGVIDDIYIDTVENNKRLDIVVLTTNQCNFSCIYCFQKREEHFLNFKQYDALILFIEEKIKKYGYQNVKIRWFGGEPLLRMEGIRYFSKNINALRKQYNFTYGCGIITNGYLLNLETFKELYKYNVVTYQISIDGLPEIKHRVMNNGNSTFEKIFENLKKIRDNIKFQMFSITIRINFTKELLARADEIVNLFYSEFGNDKRFCFSFIPVFDWSYKDSDYMKAERLNAELIHEKDVSNIMKKYGDKLDFKAWTNLLFAHNDCWAGSKHGYTIDANGDILKCDFKLEGFEENKVGTIDENGNLSFSHEKERRWIFDTPLTECYACECFPLCLSTSCGAARIQGIMQNKCLSFKQRVLDYLEIESYNSNNHFLEVSL